MVHNGLDADSIINQNDVVSKGKGQVDMGAIRLNKPATGVRHKDT